MNKQVILIVLCVAFMGAGCFSVRSWTLDGIRDVQLIDDEVHCIYTISRETYVFIIENKLFDRKVKVCKLIFSPKTGKIISDEVLSLPDGFIPNFSDGHYLYEHDFSFNSVEKSQFRRYDPTTGELVHKQGFAMSLARTPAYHLEQLVDSVGGVRHLIFKGDIAVAEVGNDYRDPYPEIHNYYPFSVIMDTALMNPRDIIGYDEVNGKIVFRKAVRYRTSTVVNRAVCTPMIKNVYERELASGETRLLYGFRWMESKSEHYPRSNGLPYAISDYRLHLNGCEIASCRAPTPYNHFFNTAYVDDCIYNFNTEGIGKWDIKNKLYTQLYQVDKGSSLFYPSYTKIYDEYEVIPMPPPKTLPEGWEYDPSASRDFIRMGY